MKLFFLLLAHDHPENVAGLARTLVRSASDAMTFIHFDARASDADFERLRTAVADDPRIRLVTNRVECRWGGFGLVEAPLNALAQIEEEGHEPDYVMLLSGSCLPCRPVAQLERYLSDNAGKEFIESEDESWITGGWRSERWRYRHWFDHKTQHPAEWLSFQVQHALGITRPFPDGLSPRFGSQWWTLTWTTLKAILEDTRKHPDRVDFFRTVWIPDEMMFQTFVHALVPQSAITGFGLTYFQFSNRGKPLVFYDDHAQYIRTLPRFFFRKISPEVTHLRQDCLAIAAEPDDGASLDEIGGFRDDYEIKIAAQTRFPKPGHVFYSSQFSDRSAKILERQNTPYIVLIGPPADLRSMVRSLPSPQFTTFGEVFSPDSVDLGKDRNDYAGLRRRDVAIRDMNPALYLSRLRERSEGIPVLTWSPLYWKQILSDMLADPMALVVTVVRPPIGNIQQDRKSLMERCNLRTRHNTALDTLTDVSAEMIERAEFEQLTKNGIALTPWLLDDHAQTPELKASDITLPDFRGTEKISTSPETNLEKDLQNCRFANTPWFGLFAATMRASLQDLLPEEVEKMRIVSENS